MLRASPPVRFSTRLQLRDRDLPGLCTACPQIVDTTIAGSRFGLLAIHHERKSFLVPQMKADGTYDLNGPLQKATHVVKCPLRFIEMRGGTD